MFIMGAKSPSKARKTSQNNGARTHILSYTWYFLALLPLLFLFISSYLLQSIISSPPDDFGSGFMFDQIAPRYDFINRVLALNLDMSWRQQLVNTVVGFNGELFQEMSQGVKILDLATGTADVAILLGKAIEQYSSPSKGHRVLGLDPSQKMLNFGESKVQQANLSSVVSLELGDARKLNKLEENSFDAATMSFGIRNVPEKELALCEIHRVLKKGKLHGKLAIMEFSEPDENSGMLGTLARVFIRYVVPSLGALLSGAPKEYMHLQNSIKKFPSPSEFVSLMERLRCPVYNEERAEQDMSTFGSYRVQKVLHMNFGSVQIYVAIPVIIKNVTE